MKNNKRVKLPKSDSIQLEAYLEVRRKKEKGMDNLTAGEKRGLKSLKKR